MAKTTKKATNQKGKAPAKKRASTAKISTKLKGLDTSIHYLRGKAVTRRPPNNPDMPQATINQVNGILNELKIILDDYSAHLRALDRKRLNGVGVRKLGFIERAYELALENSEFLPHYLTIDRFGEDIEYFIEFRALFDLTKQIEEKLWNITLQSADIAYTDALEFYSSVREAAKRRVDAAESIYKTQETYFKHKKTADKPETEKEFMRDAKAYYRGTNSLKILPFSVL